MSKVNMEQLQALQKAVPYLLKALDVQAEKEYITAGICDSRDPNGEYPNLIVINISDNKTLSIASKIVVNDDPADSYSTAYIRCKAAPDTEQ